MSRGPFGLFWRGRQLKSLVICAFMGLLPFVIYLYWSSSDMPQHITIIQASEKRYFIEPVVENENKSLLEKGCMIPSLKVDDPDIMHFFKQYPPVSCGNGFDWVELSGGKFIITPEATDKYGDVKCDLTILQKQTDFITVEKGTINDVKSGTDLEHDFYKVECTGKDGATYRNYHAGIHPKPEVLARQKAPTEDKKISLDLDVIIIGQDSMSHMAWLRHLPLTRKYLVEELKATEMWGHTVVGDGTPATIFPLLTGKREGDLPEARRGYAGAKSVDGFPWIWNDFAKAGYVTAWQEDQPGLGTFHYRLKGFENEPVDHYFRPFEVYAGKYYNRFEKYCLGSKPRHVVLNNYMKGVFDVYKNKRKWTFTFKSEDTHSDNNQGSMIDEHMRQHLKNLKDSGYLDNALLIVMSDHGARFSKIRAFAQGKQEERMPYFAIRLPESFRVKHPDIMRNIKLNSQRLTTPFDAHETLLELLDYTGSGKADISKRGVSLFKEIPIERDCNRADVDPHWCFCLDWSPVPVTSNVVSLIMTDVLTMLNKATEGQQDKCARLSLKEVKSASEYKVKDQVLKFKDTNDGGRGRYGKMNDRTGHSKIIYQITFITTPGDGLYEVTVSHDVKKNRFLTSLKSVSRINKYGKTPWCIMETIPQIRPYCVCKQPPPS